MDDDVSASDHEKDKMSNSRLLPPLVQSDSETGMEMERNGIDSAVFNDCGDFVLVFPTGTEVVESCVLNAPALVAGKRKREKTVTVAKKKLRVSLC